MKEICNRKILLVLLPFWDPQIPPLGISCLKGFLRRHGCRVKALDANTEQTFRELYYHYFKIMENHVPENKKGNFFNIGNMVLRNHMMAHIHYQDKKQYMELVKQLAYKTFYCRFDLHQVNELTAVIEEFYRELEVYVLQLLDKEKPDILGFSVFSGTLAASMFAGRLARQKHPRTKTLIGGGVFSDQLAVGTPDFEFFIEKTRDYIDKIFIGEGEELLLKFLRGELQESQRVYTLKDIAARPLDLASAVLPDFSDFDLTYYPHLSAYGARSCPHQCSFCSETVFWGAYRKKKAKQILEEFSLLSKRHSYQLFLMADSLLNPIISDLAHEVIESGQSFYWDGYLRADKPVCNPENTLLWRQGGFYRARLGIESGSLKILEKMGKKITVEQIKQAVNALAYAGIKTTTYWVIGHPGETEEDFQMTLELIQQLKDYLYEAECNPFNYYLSGQVNSSQWMKEIPAVGLYPQWAKEMLIAQTWRLDTGPSHEETMERVNRFVTHCQRLNIPNPYSLEQVNAADRRWKQLHPNAVPSLLELRDKKIGACEFRQVKKTAFAGNPLARDSEWPL